MGEVIKGHFPNVETNPESTDFDGPEGDILIIGSDTEQVRKNKIARGVDNFRVASSTNETGEQTQADLIHELGRCLQKKQKIESGELEVSSEEREDLNREIRTLADYMDLQEIEWAEMVADHHDFDEPPPSSAA